MRKLIASCALVALGAFNVYAQQPSGVNSEGVYGSGAMTASGSQLLNRANFFPVVCKINGVPANYVIIGQQMSGSCPSGYSSPYNAWEIKIPGGQEIICKVSPIPAGYVVIREEVSGKCPAVYGSQYAARFILKI